MNKRQAKIEALGIAAEILYATTDTIESGFDEKSHQKVVAEMERIAESLQRRVERLKEAE